MQIDEAIEFQWPYLRSFLPDTSVVEAIASRTGALVRRREIYSAERLLRLAMVYGFCGYSLRQTAAWARVIGIANVSDVALLKRFRASADWMCELVGQVLASYVSPPRPVAGTFPRILLVDGTTVAKPGSKGTDWRLHLGFDLREHRIATLELTDSSGGESLRRITPLAGELLIADRGYARTSGLQWILQHNAHFLVRIPWNNILLSSLNGLPFEMLDWLRAAPEAAPFVIGVRLRAGSRPLRLIALRKSEPAASASRKKILSYASNHTKRTDPRTLEAAGFTLLLTDVTEDELSALAALDLYRFRWQIELSFKSMKSLVSLDHLPAKDPNLGRMILAAKLLGALLIEQFTQQYPSFSPWGYPIPFTPAL